MRLKVVIFLISGNALLSINGRYSTPGMVSVGIPSRCVTKSPMTTQPQWLGAMNIGDDLGRNGEFCVTVDSVTRTAGILH